MLRLGKHGMTLIEDIFKLEQFCFEDGWSFESIKDFYSNDNSIFSHIYISGELVGYAFGECKKSINEAELYRIAVSSQNRKKGYGKKLLIDFKNKCQKVSCNIIFLEVRQKNFDAIKLYLNNGFETIGLRKGYYKNPDDNAVLMQYKF